LAIALGAAALVLGVVALLLFVAGQARARALAEDIRAQIEPYLRRKAAEAEMNSDAPTWNRRSSPEAIVNYSVRLASRLLEQERSPDGPESSRFALAQTQPVDDPDAPALPRVRKG